MHASRSPGYAPAPELTVSSPDTPWPAVARPASGTPIGAPIGDMPPIARGRDGKDTLVSAPWFEERAAPPPPPVDRVPLGAVGVAAGGTALVLTLVAVVGWFALG